MSNPNWKTRFALMFVYLAIQGCGGPATKKGEPKKDKPASTAHSHDDHGHDHHGHDHSHDHGAGPNGGSIVMLGKEDYHIEWLHDEASGKLTFILLDAAMKKEVTTDAKELNVEVKAGKDTRKYSASAVAKEKSEPSAPTSRFEVVDKALLVDMEIGGEVVATISVSIGGKVFTGKVEAEKEAAHDHK